MAKNLKASNKNCFERTETSTEKKSAESRWPIELSRNTGNKEEKREKIQRSHHSLTIRKGKANERSMIFLYSIQELEL